MDNNTYSNDNQAMDNNNTGDNQDSVNKQYF